MSYNIEPIKQFIDNTLSDLIHKISTDYNLDENEMKARYMQPDIKNTPSQAIKKKGRKKKTTDDFTEMTKYSYEGEMYLMDKQNNIYTYNLESPTHIGQKLVNGTIKFFDNYNQESN